MLSCVDFLFILSSRTSYARAIKIKAKNKLSPPKIRPFWVKSVSFFKYAYMPQSFYCGTRSYI